MAEDNGFAMGYALGQDSGGANNNDIFGGNGLWGLLALALVFGGGFGGFGGFGGGRSAAATTDDVRSAVDQQTLISKIDQQTYGIADSFTALNGAISSGFHGVDRGLCDVSHQISDCCCSTARAIDGINYNMEKGFCGVGNYISNATRDIIDNANANYRGIMDFMVNSKIEALTNENNALRLSVSQTAQNAYLISQLRPAPVPAFSVPAPYCYGYSNNSCGCGCA